MLFLCALALHLNTINRKRRYWDNLLIYPFGTQSVALDDYGGLISNGSLKLKKFSVIEVGGPISTRRG